MKNRFALFVMLALVSAGLTTPFAAPAYAAESVVSDGFNFTVDGSTATLTGFAAVVDSHERAVIPATIVDDGKTYTVTAIGPEAFNGFFIHTISLPDTLVTIGERAFYQSQITDLVIPDSVVTIGDWAFFNTPSLSRLTLGSGVTSIGFKAFYLSGVTDLTLPDSLVTIGAGAFERFALPSAPVEEIVLGERVQSIGDAAFANHGTARLSIPDSVTHVGERAFYNNLLTSLTLGSGLTTIADAAFATNIATGRTLESVRIPDRVTSIGMSAFFGNSIASVTFGKSLTSIGEMAFQYNGLTTLVIPDSVTTIGPRAFFANASLRTLDLGEGVLSIGEEAFRAGPHPLVTGSLESVSLPDTASSIGKLAFAYNKLTELTIPPKVARVGASAFAGNQLTTLSYGPTTIIEPYAFYENSLTHVTVPDGATDIASSAFSVNDLRTVALPDSLTTIGAGAFAYNTLSAVTIPEQVTTIGYEAFAGNPVERVRMTGPAPTLSTRAFPASTQVRFPWRYGAPRAVDGYTAPDWGGSHSIPVADVVFRGNGADSADPAPQQVDVDGVSRATPPTSPVKAGRSFAGWFADAAATVAFDLAAPVAGDLTLYAGFVDPPAPGTDPSPATVTLPQPSVTGTPHEGRTLSVRTGTVTPANAGLTFQWLSNGAAIKGATQRTLRLKAAQAGTTIAVTVTARVPGRAPVSRTSASTEVVTSTKLRLHLSTRKVAKGKPVVVTATGLKPRQRVTIHLGARRYPARADSRGVVRRSLRFTRSTKAGKQRIEVRPVGRAGKRVTGTVAYR